MILVNVGEINSRSLENGRLALRPFFLLRLQQKTWFLKNSNISVLAGIPKSLIEAARDRDREREKERGENGSKVP